MALCNMISLLGNGAKMVGCIFDVSTLYNTLADPTGQCQPRNGNADKAKSPSSEKRGITMSPESK